MKKDFFNKVLEAHRIGINESVSIRPNDLYDMLYWVTEAFDERFLVLEKMINDSPVGFLLREENADLAENLVGEDAIFDAFFSKCNGLKDAANRLNESDPGGRRDIAFDDCEDYLDQATRLFAELKSRAERKDGTN
jgi:hypothetical protein